MFCEDVLHRPIWGFSFQIDIYNHPPICYKSPRYGPHKSEVIQKLAEILDKTFVVEEDDVPWGALVVLSAKPHQDNVP